MYKGDGGVGTFDEWFDDTGYTIRLPKSSPENHDELKRFRLPTWPLTMQEQYEMQVLEQQRQKEEQQKNRSITEQIGLSSSTSNPQNSVFVKWRKLGKLLFNREELVN